jgi:hypothetical protein
MIVKLKKMNVTLKWDTDRNTWRSYVGGVLKRNLTGSDRPEYWYPKDGNKDNLDRSNLYVATPKDGVHYYKALLNHKWEEERPPEAIPSVLG